MESRYTRSSAIAGWIIVLLSALVLSGCGQPPTGQDVGLRIMSAHATSQTSIEVAFNVAVGTGANDPANYRVSGPNGSRLEVIAAYLSEDGLRVTLATEPQQQVTYGLSLRDVYLLDGGMSSEITSLSGFSGSGDAAPIVASAIALSDSQVLVTFTYPTTAQLAEMGPGALMPANYEVSDPSLDILGAAFADSGADKSRVILTTSAMSDVTYSIAVTNVLSAQGSKLVDPFLNTAEFRGIAQNDTTSPTVMDAFATSNTTIVVRFSEPVSEAAVSPSNYLLTESGGEALPVVAAVLNEFKTEVTLTTWPMTAGVSYRLVIAGITDRNGNPIGANTTTFSGTPVDASNDTKGPRVLSANSIGNTTVVVTFDEPVAGGSGRADSAENPQNYSIEDSRPTDTVATQAIVVVQEAVLSASKRSVTLTTLSQSEVGYTLTVTNVKDLVGNQISPPDRANPYQVTFFGTGIDGTPTDSDGDGLSDAEEQFGWTVFIQLADGETTQRIVTSNPGDPRLDVEDPANVAARDTDGDGIADADEKAYRTDPRNADADDDGLTDYQELNDYYSEPTMQDTDGDGLIDGLEVNFFRTSPLLADTDGDQLPDDYEIVTDNRNPRIADLPRVDIKVGVVDLRLDVRFEEQTSTGTRRLDGRSVETTLAQSEESAQSRETSSTLEWFVKGGAELCLGGSCDTEKPAGAKFSVEGGASGSSSTTFSTASVRATQREYATSLNTEAEVSAESVVTRVVEGATMAVEVNLANASNIAFTISDIEITALLQDPRDPSIFVPVATLFGASGSPISIGPLTPERGPFRFSTDNAFPSLVESLMANPRGLVFRIANYDIVDEFGRNFAFVEQDVNDRTAFLEINFAGNEPLERHQVATNGTFDASGRPSGITMARMLEEVLGLEYVDEVTDEALDATVRADADLLDRSYSTRSVNGVDTLWRVKRVSRELTGQERDWWVLGPLGNISPVGDRPGLDFREYTIFADQDYAFAFVQDLDGDDLEANEESFYRSIDSDRDDESPFGVPDSRDSDRDGIADADEIYGPFVGNRRIRWLIRPEDGRDAYQTMAHPGRVDSDGDGLDDCQELLVSTTCSLITIYETADGVPTLAPTSTNGTAHVVLMTTRLTNRTDPSNPDSDGDGLTDMREAIGFKYTNLSGTDVILTPATNSATPYATNPLNRDTDRDGLDDILEVRLGSNPVAPDGNTVRDDDADGLVNAVETTGWSVTARAVGGTLSTRAVTSDPKLEDTDGDGLTDWEEYQGCRDANRDRTCDTDVRFGRLDPRSTDTDGDNLGDRQEVDGVDFPSDANAPFRVTDPLRADTDSDGRGDGAEVNTSWIVEVAGRGGYPVWSDPLRSDADGDSLNDSAEFSARTDPNLSDTDGDGALDGLEAAASRPTDPLVPDHLVTVVYLSLQAGKGSDSAAADGDSISGDPGDFFFHFDVRVPNAYGDLIWRNVTNSATVPVRGCATWDDFICRNNNGNRQWVQIAAPLKFDMYQSTTFAVPYTSLFTIEGVVQELDNHGPDEYADVSYFFGGFGDPANGTYAGSELTKGSFSVAFNQSPEPSVPLEITVLVRVE